MSAHLHAEEIVELARALWGAPNKERSTRDDVRFGAHGSKSVNRKTGQWFDHETGKGGGYASLFEEVNGHPPQNGHDSGITATYDYRDATGALLFQVARKIPKDFRQRRPDGNGGWIWNLQGTERVLYKLPELLSASPGATVFIPEGEKDVDALREHLLVATCNPGGARKWLPQFGEHLRGRDVVILPDNDADGEAHAPDVATKLCGVAQSIRIVRLPGLPPKGDVSDWLAAGGTAEQLEQLAAKAPEWQPPLEPEPPIDPLGLWDAGDDDYAIPPRGWLLGTTFCRRFLSSLVADGGVGKTALRLAQLISLATGRNLAGEHVFVRSRVLIVSLEDDRDELRRRVYAVVRHHDISPAELKGWLFLAAPKGLRLAEMREGAPAVGPMEAMIRNTIEQRRIDVVSLDPFIKSHGMGENDNNAIDFVCTLLAKIAIDRDCAIDLPHHTKKGMGGGAGDADRSRGASAMKDAARLVYTLTPMTTDEADQFGVAEAERRSLIRLDSGKVNIAPPSREAKWFRLVGVPLANGTALYPHGDEVQTVKPWEPPDTWGGLDSALLNRMLDRIDAGLPGGSRYSSSGNAADRAAWRVVIENAPDKKEKQAREIIRIWIKSGTLYKEPYEDPTARKTFQGLRVNAAKRPS